MATLKRLLTDCYLCKYPGRAEQRRQAESDQALQEVQRSEARIAAENRASQLRTCSRISRPALVFAQRKGGGQPDSCILLRLPAELRHNVYKHVLTPTGRDIRLKLKGGDGGHRFQRVEWSDTNRTWAQQPAVSLLFVCRQIYLELVDFVYEENTIVLMQPFGMTHLAKHIDPYSFRNIRSLYLDLSDYITWFTKPASFQAEGVTRADDWTGWQETCEIVKSLPKLRLLKVSPPHFYLRQGTMERIFETLRALAVPPLAILVILSRRHPGNWRVEECVREILPQAYVRCWHRLNGLRASDTWFNEDAQDRKSLVNICAWCQAPGYNLPGGIPPPPNTQM